MVWCLGRLEQAPTKRSFSSLRIREKFIYLVLAPLHSLVEVCLIASCGTSPGQSLVWGLLQELFAARVLIVGFPTRRLFQGSFRCRSLIQRLFAEVSKVPMKNESGRERCVPSSLSWTTCTWGDPDACMEELRMRRPLSKSQWDGVRRIEFLLKAWIEVSPVDAETMGRTAGKIESLEDSLRALEKAATIFRQEGRGYFSNKTQEDHGGSVVRGWTAGMLLKEDEFSTFKEVDPRRLAFTGFPAFRPSKFLDELGRKVYNDPLAMRMSPEECKLKQPRLKVHCSNKDKVFFVRTPGLFQSSWSPQRFRDHRELRLGVVCSSQGPMEGSINIGFERSEPTRASSSKMDPIPSLWGGLGENPFGKVWDHQGLRQRPPWLLLFVWDLGGEVKEKCPGRADACKEDFSFGRSQSERLWWWDGFWLPALFSNGGQLGRWIGANGAFVVGLEFRTGRPRRCGKHAPSSSTFQNLQWTDHRRLHFLQHPGSIIRSTPFQRRYHCRWLDGGVQEREAHPQWEEGFQRWVGLHVLGGGLARWRWTHPWFFEKSCPPGWATPEGSKIGLRHRLTSGGANWIHHIADAVPEADASTFG